MKRVAESQLTKDTGDSDDEESTDVGKGFQKADPSVLGSRIIRGLPKRNLALTSAPSTPGQPGSTSGPPNGTAEQSPEPVSRFGAFTGFGATSGTTSAFSFTVPSSQTNNTPAQSTTAPSAIFSSMPASTASKSFPSYPNPSNPTPPSTPPLTPDAQNKQDAALKYYMSLRGINSSFLDAVTNAVQADPFVDVGEILEKYKSLRLAIQQEFDSHSKTSGTGESAKPNPLSIASQGFSTKVSPSSTPALTSTGFGTSPVASGSIASTGGFIPQVDTSSVASVNPFAWSKPSEPTRSDKPPSVGSSVAFGNTTMPVQTPVESHFPLRGPVPAVTNASTKPAVASHSIFEVDKQAAKTDTSSFSSKLSTSAPPLTPGLSSFLGPSKPSSTTGEASTPSPIKFGAQSASPPSPSTFGFGSGKNIGVSNPFGSFNKGSIGNPVGFGFGFGGPPMATNADDTANSAASSETKASADIGSGAEDSPGDGSPLVPLATGHDPSPAPSQGSAYDADGPGEEEESTLHETKAQAYKMISTDEKKKGWTSVGTGMMKLKAHNELAKRRILMRNSSTGQVILNFNLLPPFQVTADKNTISFRVPGEDESGTVYRLKLPTEADALKWQETIHDELAHRLH